MIWLLNVYLLLNIIWTTSNLNQCLLSCLVVASLTFSVVWIDSWPLVTAATSLHLWVRFAFLRQFASKQHPIPQLEQNCPYILKKSNYEKLIWPRNIEIHVCVFSYQCTIRTSLIIPLQPRVNCDTHYNAMDEGSGQNTANDVDWILGNLKVVLLY